jgi:hypothetical protein
MKTCSRCKESKPLNAFGKCKSNKDGLAYTCSPCRTIRRKENRLANKEAYDASQKKYRKAHPDKYAEWRYKSRHGITKTQMYEILKEQGGCKLCGSEDFDKTLWVVDHDHRCCGKLKSCEKCRRGVICEHCNKMLGFAKDNVEVLAKAIEYLEEYERNK